MMQQMLVGLGGGPAIADSVSYWAIGGGGSGGYHAYAGGGSGQIPQQGTWAPTGGSAYTVTIGAGGAGASSYGTNGSSSSISSVVSASGGEYPPPTINGSMNRDGAPNQQYIGGTSDMGGGAGAGGNGLNGPIWYKGGDGGPGVTVPIYPTTLTIGGGGGGGDDSGNNPNKSGQGTDGGGTRYTNGVPNSGGGGGAVSGPSGYGSSGGSGRVVLRYADSFPAATATTGSPTITVSGGYRHYDFTSSGSITF